MYKEIISDWQLNNDNRLITLRLQIKQFASGYGKLIQAHSIYYSRILFHRLPIVFSAFR